MYLIQNSQLHRSSRSRIFETPINETLSLSRGLSTNFTPLKYNQEEKQFIKTTQFSLNTPVNQSIQESQFQEPAKAKETSKIQNTPQFSKQNKSLVRSELRKFQEDEQRIWQDQESFESEQSSSKDSFNYSSNKVKTIENTSCIKTNYEFISSKKNIGDVPLKVSDLQIDQIEQQIIEKEQQLESSTNSNKQTQNVKSEEKVEIEQKSEIIVNSVKNENDEQQFSISGVQISQEINQIPLDQQNINHVSINEQLEELVKGIQVIKYSRNQFCGKKKRLLQITPDLKLIIFRNQDHKITKIYSINKITKIEKGIITETFRPYKLKSDMAYLCYSIFLDERTVDLSCQNEQQLDLIINCIDALLSNK